MKLGCYAEGAWVTSAEDGVPLRSAVNGDVIAEASSAGLDYGAMVGYARQKGGAALRKMTFHDRAFMIKALAQYLMEHKKEFYELSTQTGATRKDSWIDIDGGIFLPAEHALDHIALLQVGMFGFDHLADSGGAHHFTDLDRLNIAVAFVDPAAHRRLEGDMGEAYEHLTVGNRRQFGLDIAEVGFLDHALRPRGQAPLMVDRLVHDCLHIH